MHWSNYCEICGAKSLVFDKTLQLWVCNYCSLERKLHDDRPLSKQKGDTVAREKKHGSETKTVPVPEMVVTRIEATRSVGLTRDYITLKTAITLSADVKVSAGDVAAVDAARKHLSTLADQGAKGAFNEATGALATRTRDLIEAEMKNWEAGIPIHDGTQAATKDAEKKAASDSDSDSDGKKGSDSDSDSDSGVVGKGAAPGVEIKVKVADVQKMDKKALKALVKEHSLDIDVKAFDEIDELRQAVCDDLLGPAAESDSDSDSDAGKKGKKAKTGKKGKSDSDSDSDKKSDSDSDSDAKDKKSDSDSDSD